jgi:hypothetical protein
MTGNFETKFFVLPVETDPWIRSSTVCATEGQATQRSANQKAESLIVKLPNQLNSLVV